MARIRISDMAAGALPIAGSSLIEASVVNGAAPSGYDTKRYTIADLLALAGAPIANLNLLANISGSTASASGNTLSSILDAAVGSSRGTLLYRGASGWAGLAPGTSGEYLQTGGAAADPSWASVTGGGGSGLSGMTAGQIPIAATATTVTSSANLSGDVTTSGSLAATVTRIQGQPVSATAPTGTQVLQWNGSAWAPTTLAAGGTTPTVTTKITSYTVQASDLGNTLILAGSPSTLTLPAGIFTAGKSLAISAPTSWVITNSTGLTMVGLNAGTVGTGTSGSFVANADGSTLNFVPGTQLPTASALGGVKSISAGANSFLTGLNTSGIFSSAQPSFANISGTATIAQGGTGQTTAAAALTALGGLSTATAASTYLRLDGGTLTGGVTIAPPSGNASIGLDHTGSNNSTLYGLRGGLVRWDFVLGFGAEGGSNAGSDFSISRYNDAGGWINAALTINRATGACANTSGSWTAVSDGSLKQEIEPYKRGLEAIINLEPVAFRYKAGTLFAPEAEPSEVHYGLIAEEVKPHMPEIVGEMTTTVRSGETQTFGTLEPGNLVYAFINSFKELAAKNAALEARLAALEATREPR